MGEGIRVRQEGRERERRQLDQHGGAHHFVDLVDDLRGSAPRPYPLAQCQCSSYAS